MEVTTRDPLAMLAGACVQVITWLEERCQQSNTDMGQLGISTDAIFTE